MTLPEKNPPVKLKPKSCNFHKDVKLGYVEWHDWAATQDTEQVQCADCGRWLFPCEFGDPKESE